MKIQSLIIGALLGILVACANAPLDPAAAARRSEAEKTAACKRSPYCGTINPAGKPEDQREAELRDVREAVKSSQQ